MTTSGHHAAEDGSLARSTGGAAARGALLIALALAIGLLLVTFALDDPQTEIVAGTDADAADVDEGDAANDGAGDGGDATPPPAVGEPSTTEDRDATDTNTDTIPTIEDELVVDPPVEGEDGAAGPGQLLPSNEVTVLVANGTGGAGVAGGIQDILVADGYTAEVTNAPATVEGVIFYKPGFDQNARAIADVLGAAPDVVLLAPESIGVSAEAIADGRVERADIVVIIGTNNAVPPA